MADFADIAPRRRGDTGTVTGVVTVAVSGGVATVDVGTASLVVNVVRGLTPAVGDIVLIAKQGSARWLQSILFTTPPPTPVEPPDVPPPPAPTVVTGSTVITPVETRTYRDGRWRTDTDDVIQGLAPGSGYGNNTGAVFYGKAPRSLSGATVTSARLRVARARGGDFAARAPTLRLITQSTRPAGYPTLGASTTGPALAVGKSTTNFA